MDFRLIFILIVYTMAFSINFHHDTMHYGFWTYFNIYTRKSIVYSIRMKISPKSIVYTLKMKISPKSLVYSIRMKISPNSIVYSVRMKISPKFIV